MAITLDTPQPLLDSPEMPEIDLTSIPQSLTPPDMTEGFGENPWDVEAREESARRDEMLSGALAKIDKAALDPEAYFKGQDISLSLNPIIDQRAATVDAFLRLQNGGEPFDTSPNPLANDLTRATIRQSVAHTLFDGRGADDDDAFFTEIQKSAQNRIDRRALGTTLATKAHTAALISLTDPSKETEFSWPTFREEARKAPGYTPDDEASLYEAYHASRAESQAALAAFAPELQNVWNAMKTGPAGNFSQVAQAVIGDMLGQNPDKPMGRGREELAKKDAPRLALDAYYELTEEERPQFMQALATLARTLPKEQQAAFFSNLAKQGGRDIDDLARNIGSIGIPNSSEQDFQRRKVAMENREGENPVARFLLGGEGGGIDAALYNPAMEESMRGAQSKLLAARNFASDVRNIERQDYNPVKSAWGDEKMGILETGLYGVPGALASSALVTIPYVGPVAMFSSMEGAAYDDIRRNLMASGMTDADATTRAAEWATITAVPQAALEKLQAAALVGKLPFLDKFFTSLGDKLTSNATRFALRTTTGAVQETAIEAAQDFIPHIAQELAATLSEQIPHVTWSNGKDGALDGFWTQQATTLVTMLPLAIIGAAGGLSADQRVQAFQNASDNTLLALGASREQLAELRAAQAQGIETVRRTLPKILDNLDPTSETAKAAVKTLVDEELAKKSVAQEATQSGILPRFTRTAEGWTLHDSETGAEIGTAPNAEAALRLAITHTDSIDEADANRFAYMVTMLEAGDFTALTESLTRKTTTEFRPGETVTAAQQAALSPEDAARVAAQMELKEKMEGGTGEVTGVVFGQSSTTFENSQRRTVNRLNQGASVLTVFHEETHGFWREALRTGRLKREHAVSVLRALDTILAKKTTREGQPIRFLPADFNTLSTQEQDTAIDEAISELMEAEVLRTRKGTGVRKIPAGIISRNLAALTRIAGGEATNKFRAFARALRSYFGIAIDRAAHLDRALKDGTINQSLYNEFLTRLLGQEEQAALDQQARDYEQEITEGTAAPEVIPEGDPFSLGTTYPRFNLRPDGPTLYVHSNTGVLFPDGHEIKTLPAVPDTLSDGRGAFWDGIRNGGRRDAILRAWRKKGTDQRNADWLVKALSKADGWKNSGTVAETWQWLANSLNSMTIDQGWEVENIIETLPELLDLPGAVWEGIREKDYAYIPISPDGTVLYTPVREQKFAFGRLPTTAEVAEAQAAHDANPQIYPSFSIGKDRSHLDALELSLSRERVRLQQAKTDGEKRQREVWVAQIEKEISDERAFLGIDEPEPDQEMSDEDLLAQLMGESFSIGRATVTPTDSTRTFQGQDGQTVIGPASFSIAPDYGINHRPTEDGPRAHDLAEGDMMPTDVYDHPEWYSGMGKKIIAETMKQLRAAKGKADAILTIYRAGPVGEMNPGDWVSLSKEYARTHADAQDPEGFKVWESKVKAQDVRWAMDDLAEFGYFGEKSEATESNVSFSIGAYHGTPHKVDKFTTAKIGTGEGAQAYGWGLYFAQSQKVGEEYRRKLSNYNDAVATIDGRTSANTLVSRALAKTGGNKDATISYLTEMRGKFSGFADQLAITKAIEELESATELTIALPGNLYRVTLKVEEEELLDWDKPFREQSEIVKTALTSLGIKETADNGGGLLGQGAYETLYSRSQSSMTAVMYKEASELLSAAGIKGIRFLDGNSRNSFTGWKINPPKSNEGMWIIKSSDPNAIFFEAETEAEAVKTLKSLEPQSYNYVIFNEADIEILEENGQPVSLSPDPSLSPSSFSIGTRRVMPTNYPESAREIVSTTNVKGITHALLKPGEQLVILDEEAEKPMMVSPAYKAAKRGGNKQAAWDIARLFLTGKRVAPYKAAIGDLSPVFVPVRQEEGAKQNLLPIAAAWALQKQLGGRVADTVLQLKKGGLTGADNNERSKKDHDFEGTLEIQPGETVVLIDDTFTSGSTLTSLYDHLSAQRIEAEHIFSIASGRYTKNIAATTEQITRALDKVGMSEEEFQRATGIPIQAFTGAELAAYSLNGARGIEGFALRFDVGGNTGSGSMVPSADAGLAPSFSIGGMKAANWTNYQSQGRAFTGADGKPRFEMDASKATLNANAIKDPAHRNGYKRLGENSPVSWFVPDGMDTPLGNILDFDELYENYPELAGLKVNLHHGDPSTRGSFARTEINGKVSLGFSTIYLSGELKAGQILSTLLHEVQHAIQAVEGFPRGSSPKAETKRYNTLLARRNGIQTSGEMREYERKTDEVFQRFNRDEITAEEMYATIESLGKSDPAYQELLSVEEELQSITQYGIGNFDAFRAYKKNPGEKEARGVQARQSMTDEERAASPFMASYESYSLGPAALADAMRQGAIARIKDPQRRVRAMANVARKMEAIHLVKARLELIHGSKRAKASLRKEAAFREASLAEQYENEAYARHYGILDDDDLRKIKSQPVHAYLSDPDSPLRGTLMSKSRAIKDHPDLFRLHRAGDYDGSDGVSRSVFGGTRMPDQAAQDLYDANLIKEPTADALWQALLKEQSMVANMKELHAKAKDDLRSARTRAKQETNEWLAQQERTQDSKFSPKQEILSALALLDAILSSVSPEIRGKVGGYTQLAQLGSDEHRLTFLTNRLEKVDTLLEQELRTEFGREMEALLKRARPQKDAPGEKPKGTAGSDVHDLFREVEKYMSLPMIEAEGRAADLEARIATGELSPEEESHSRLLADLLLLVGDWTTADAARRESAVTEATRIFARGYLEHRIVISARSEARQRDRAKLKANTGKSGVRAERRQEAKKKATKLGRTLDSLLSLLSFEQITQLAFGKDSEIGNRLVDWERRASYARQDAIDAKTQAIEDLFVSLAGSSLAGEKLRYEMGNTDSVTVKNSRGTHNFTQLEAISATLMWMQADGRRHMEGFLDDAGNPIGEWGWTEADMAAIEDQLTAEAKAVRVHLQEQYGAEYDRLNTIYRDLNGINLPRNKFYSPLTVKPQNVQAGQVNDPVSGFAVSAGFSPGSLKTRSQSAVAEPDFRDALATYIGHTTQIEHYIAYAPFASEAMALINTREVGNSVEAAAGAETLSLLRKWLDHFSQGGNRDAAAYIGFSQGLNRKANRVAAAALVGRVSVLAIQSTQLGAALAQMPTGSYLSRFAKLTTGQLDWGAAINSDYIQRRIRQMPPIVRQAMEGLQGAEPNRIKHAMATLGRTISGADALFTAGTYAIIYDYQKSQGLTGQELIAATERAVERVAQPTRTGTRSFYEVSTSGNPSTRILWAFASEPRQKLALVGFALAKGTTSEKARSIAVAWIIGGVVASLIRATMRDIRDSDDEELFDERNWSPKRLALMSLTGPLGGLPVAGDLLETAAFKAVGEYVPEGNLFSSVGGILRLKNVPDWFTGDRDADEMIGDIDAILSALAPISDTNAAVSSAFHIVKDAEGIIRNLLEIPD